MRHRDLGAGDRGPFAAETEMIEAAVVAAALTVGSLVMILLWEVWK